MTAGIGHNGGPTLDAGRAWRLHAWTAARAALLPALPVEVVRLRVARARELGLPYRTYAGIRAATGQDVIALLFSSNALRLHLPRPALPAARAACLGAVSGAPRIALAVPPLSPDDAAAACGTAIDAAHAAPRAFARWREIAAAIRAATGALPAGGCLLVGEGAPEAEWAVPARLAGFLPAEAYFG